MRILVVILVCAGLISCENEMAEPLNDSLLVIPGGFPDPDFPEDNQLSKERWELGKRLFFDPVLSVDRSISCSTCHKPEFAFSDGLKVSEGVEHRLGKRNAPTLANVAYHPYFTREGGVPTLEMQVQVPIQEHNEFDFNINLIAERLKADSSYLLASRVAYGRDPDAFVITRAISCFERTLFSGSSKYDLYEKGNILALNTNERHGRELFFSERLSCTHCHGGFNFTSYAFENNGLYENYEDPGRFHLTGDDKDLALFKVPSLRNVSVTAPYMHDGSLASLEEVIDHYNSGGKNHPHKSAFVKPLHLTVKEKADVVAFLKALTDNDFITNPKFHQ